MRAIVLAAVAALALTAAYQPNGAAAAKLTFFDRGFGGTPGFYDFDTESGVSTLRSGFSTGPSNPLVAMDVRPSDQVIFGVTFNTSLGVSSSLLTVDIDTGSTTFVGLTGESFTTGIAFDPDTGDLFGLDQLGNLYSVDQTTGAFSLIGDTSSATRGLSFSPDGTLYGFGEEGAVFTIDPATAVATALSGAGAPIDSITQDSTFTPAGALFVADFDGDLIQIDPLTGDPLGSSTTGEGSGLAALIPFQPVPEPAALALLLSGLVGLFSLQRQRETRPTA